jgi:hypothetical protein
MTDQSELCARTHTHTQQQQQEEEEEKKKNQTSSEILHCIFQGFFCFFVTHHQPHSGCMAIKGFAILN